MKRLYRGFVWAGLILFFVLAALLTRQSQKNYLKNCIPVELLKNTTSGSLMITKSTFAACDIGADGIFTFCWNDREVYEKILIGDEIRVDVGNRFISAEIVNRFESDGNRTYTARIESLAHDVFAAWQNGFTVTASYRGEQRAYIVPASCVMEEDGDYKVAVAAEEKKAWGTAYKVRYETVRIHEINGEQCSLQGLPVNGEIIFSGEGRLWEGADILILE